MKQKIIILAGGSGERLWPLSRKTKPKQILPLLSAKPLILDTINRYKIFDGVTITTNQLLKSKIEKYLTYDCKVIVEPFNRNTAPAIGLTLMKLIEEYDDIYVFIGSSDHDIKDEELFHRDIKRMFEFAVRSKKIVVLGTVPSFPNPKYGYIRSGKQLEGNFSEIEEFVEKPNIELTRKIYSKSNYMWNSGMLCGNAKLILNEYQKFLPNLYKSLEKIKNHNFEKLILKEEYNNMKPVSISRGILEKSKNLAVLKSPLIWTDVGGYTEIPSQYFKFNDKNNSTQEITALKSINNIVISKKVVALIGIEDTIIVETDDVIFLCKKNQIDKIKELIKQIPTKFI